MVFVNGRQKWIRRRPPLIDGMEEDEFILRNADPIWLHQNEMWWCITEGDESERQSVEREAPAPDDEEVPF